jgi:hypothetical protein
MGLVTFSLVASLRRPQPVHGRQLGQPPLAVHRERGGVARVALLLRERGVPQAGISGAGGAVALDQPTPLNGLDETQAAFPASLRHVDGDSLLGRGQRRRLLQDDLEHGRRVTGRVLQGLQLRVAVGHQHLGRAQPGVFVHRRRHDIKNDLDRVFVDGAKCLVFLSKLFQLMPGVWLFR